MISITKLACPACGGKVDQELLDILYTCPYCGNQFLITQDNGVASLHTPTGDLQQVQKNIRKAASEQSIKRIQAELEDLYSQRAPYQAKWNHLSKMHRKNLKLGFWTKLFLFSLFVSFVIFIWAIVKDKMAFGLTSLLVIFLSIFSLIVIAIRTMRQKKYEKDYVQLARIIIPLDEIISTKQTELKKHQLNING